MIDRLSVLKSLLGERIVDKINDIDSLNEVRMRRNNRLGIIEGGRYRLSDLIIRAEDIAYTLDIASNSTIFSVEESIARGFISCKGGIRVGVAGEGVYDGRKFKTLKNISSLTVRIPREVRKLPAEAERLLKPYENTLIVSPPAGGKTTMLREMARRLSGIYGNILIIDERYELSGIVNGAVTLDVGESTDIIAGVEKKIAYEMAVRGCNPRILVTDEIFGLDDVHALKDCVRAGVGVLASMHGNGERAIELCPGIKEIFRRAVILSEAQCAGCVKSIVSLS